MWLIDRAKEEAKEEVKEPATRGGSLFFSAVPDQHGWQAAEMLCQQLLSLFLLFLVSFLTWVSTLCIKLSSVEARW